MIFSKRLASSLQGIFRRSGRQLLFGHHFAGQLARHDFAQVIALLSRFEHGLSRAVMFGDAGCGFGVELIDRCISLSMAG